MSTQDNPCIGICKIAPAQGWCIGCGRSYDEARIWHRLSDAERRTLFAQLAGRLAEMGIVRKTASTKPKVY